MKRIAFFLFFLSGLSGLLLETVWFRQLASIFGSSSLATATVSAAFLGGLGIGSIAASMLVDTLKRRFLAYGFLELFIGIYALTTPFIITELEHFQASLFGGGILDAGFYSVIRFIVIFLALLPPTMAMGATLPLLTRAITDQDENIGGSIGSLYGINTLGAFFGVMLGGFIILPNLGQHLSSFVAAFISLFVGSLAVLGFALLKPKTIVTKKITENQSKLKHKQQPMRPYALLYAFMFFSGFLAMLVQVSFTRIFSMLLGSSVYSFTLTIAVFLAGIGIGSIIYAVWLVRRVEPYQLLAICQATLGVTLIIALLFADRMPQLLLYYAQNMDIAVHQVFILHSTIIALLLFLPVLSMGVSFPVALSLLSKGCDSLGHDVGRATFVNTIGAVSGSFLAAFVMIPKLGLQTTVAYAAGLALVWTALFYSTKQGFLYKKRVMITLPVAVGVAGLLLFMPHWDMQQLTSGMFRFGAAKKIEGKRIPRSALLYYRDGPVATVTVERRKDILTMRINGKVEASNRFDMPTQIMVGMLPILMHEKTVGLKAALIGYGSGVTAGAMLQTNITKLKAVELEPRVIEASRYFKSVNFEPQKDKRMELITGDARTVLGYGADKFDVIVSEPSNPWVAGASSLFTVDFYEKMRKRLNEGGIYGQWIQLYELSPENFKILIRSFKKVFPHVLIFSASERGVDLVLLGSEKPLRLKVNKMLEKVKSPSVKEALKRAGIGGAYDLFALLSVTEKELEKFAGHGKLNTDDNGLIEFSAPMDMMFFDKYTENAIDFHFSGENGHIFELLEDLGKTKNEQALNVATLGLHLLAHGKPNIAYELGYASLDIQVTNLGVEVVEVSEMLHLEKKHWPLIPNGWLVSEKTDERYIMLGMAVGNNNLKEAIKLVNELSKTDADLRLQYIKGVLMIEALEFEKAYKHLKPLADNENFRKQNPELDFYAGRAADRQMKFQESIGYLARFNVWRKANDLPLVFEEPQDMGSVDIDVRLGE